MSLAGTTNRAPGPQVAAPAGRTGRPAGAIDRLRHRAADATVWYLRLLVLLNLLAVVSAPFRDEVHDHDTGAYFTPYLATAGLVSAVLATFLAVVMRRRKRAAWIFNLVLAAPLLALYALAMTQESYRRHGFNWFSTVLTGLFVAALLLGRREFRAKGDRSNTGWGAVALVGAVAVCGTAGTLLVTATDRLPGSSLPDRISYALLRTVTLGPGLGGYDSVAVPYWVDAVINVTAAVALLLVLYAFLHAPRGGGPLTPEDERRLRALLARYGARDSLGYFALRRDKAVVFSPSGKAAVVYRVVGGVSLASGDPVGDVEAWPGAIGAWLAGARAHAWVPAVVGAGRRAGTVYGRYGLSALELGDEAVVEHGGLTLEGRSMRPVRQAYHRVRRAGYTVRVRRHRDVPAPEMARLVALADRWRGTDAERGFSMALGRLGDPADGGCVMVECHDREGVVRGLLSFVPWGGDGLSLDVMRRDRGCDNGLVEFMVVELVRRSREFGVERVSLNFAVFRSVFERCSQLGAGPVLRLWCAVLTFLSRWWQIESLYRANAKYRPLWAPRFLLYENGGELPRVALACARAEGFLTVPRPPPPLRRRHRPLPG